jgi:hypothetical protein
MLLSSFSPSQLQHLSTECQLRQQVVAAKHRVSLLSSNWHDPCAPAGMCCWKGATYAGHAWATWAWRNVSQTLETALLASAPHTQVG